MMNELNQNFEKQQRGFLSLPYPRRAQRFQLLKTLESLILDQSGPLEQAISEDFGYRSPMETQISELFVAVQGLRYARRHLNAWMSPTERGTSFWALPSKSEVRYQPKGVVGVISPWNYPLLLTISPLTYAWAAGNRVMLKLPEQTPRFSALLAKLLQQTFESEWVCAVQGGPSVGQSFARLPFDHLLFTGSTEVGKKVLAAGASNLTPMTLELGGKCPALVTPSADLLQTARKIMMAKLLNAGQTCIAPDFLLVRQERKQELLEHLRAAATQMLPQIKIKQNYTSLINRAQYDRIERLYQEAIHQGAKEFRLVRGQIFYPEERVVAPVVLEEPSLTSGVMTEEIFGPLLPVVGFKNLEEGIQKVNQHPRPLALYLFSKKASEIKMVSENTVSGSLAINTCLTQFSQDDLPFGGIGASGMGRYHGPEGFKTFSNEKAVFHQASFDLTTLFHLPYTHGTRRLMRLMLRR